MSFSTPIPPKDGDMTASPPNGTAKVIGGIAGMEK